MDILIAMYSGDLRILSSGYMGVGDWRGLWRRRGLGRRCAIGIGCCG